VLRRPSRWRKWLGASTFTTAALVCLCVLGVDARPQAPTPQAQGALTPGSVALQAITVDQALVSALPAALAHVDPAVRVVAARVVGVSRISLLLPDVVSALGRERDEGAAAELLLALLLLDTPAALAAAEAHVARVGAPAIPVLARWLARTSPDRFAERLPELAGRIDIDADSLRQVSDAIRLAIDQHPAARGQVLRASLAGLGGRRLDRVLSLWPIASASPDEVSALVEALASSDPALRQTLVWAIVEWFAGGADVPRAILDAVSEERPAAQPVTWELFGRELVARRHRKARTPDRAELVAREAANQIDESEGVQELLADLMPSERAALRVALGARFESAAKRQMWAGRRPPWLVTEATQPGMRTVTSPWPGFLSSLLSASGCEYANAAPLVAIRVSYRVDGRPAKATLGTSASPPKCVEALKALLRILRIDDLRPVIEGQEEWVVLPLRQEFIACADEEARPGAARRAAASGPGIIVPPRKIRDVEPTYPKAEQAARVQGVVTVDATVTTQGCVSGVSVVSGPSESLKMAALAAVTQWRYTPTLVDGRPISTQMNVKVNFTLR
jgi:TonB family protein